MKEVWEAEDRVERVRQETVPAAFPEGDPRRLLKDTILGFPAALFSEVSRRLGEADPKWAAAVNPKTKENGARDCARPFHVSKHPGLDFKGGFHLKHA
jgi:hypothetical protein